MELLTKTNEIRSSYKPQKKAELWLDEAMKHIKSVDYKVSARWVSYRLLQDGIISSKKYFGQLDKYMSSARKIGYKDWTPFTLADSIREPVNASYPGSGNPNEIDIEEIAQEQIDTMSDFYIDVSRWWYEDNYLEIWYEARAMTGQFMRYAPYGVTLQPCGGDVSIPMKAEGARRIERWSRYTGKPAVVLYFGDLDKKGLQIPQAATNDLLTWCRQPLSFYRVGLTAEQVERFNLPDNPEKPGSYQWEALTDPQAVELIKGAVSQFVSDEAYEKSREEAEKLEDGAKAHFKELLKDWLE